MTRARVLFVTRPDAHARTGGDAVQATHTAQALRQLDYSVDIAATDAPDARGYDLAHLFGVFDPDLAQAQMDACERSGTPVVLSPIWWDLTDFFARSAAVERALAGTARLVDSRLRAIRERSAQQLASRRRRKAFEQRKERQRTLMMRAKVLLPNSITEAHRYVLELGLQHPNVHVVPNAVDADLFPDNDSAERSGLVCVGRIESRKNQAMLAYAMRETDIEIVLAGECYDAYYRQLCERWNSRVRFTGAMPHDEALQVMRRSAVHVLPAWLETPGIASLEAARAGCAVVCGNRASEFEYFRGSAWYCDPGDPVSIRSAVLNAVAAAKNGGVRSREQVRAFTWEAAAEATATAYREVL